MEGAVLTLAFFGGGTVTVGPCLAGFADELAKRDRKAFIYASAIRAQVREMKV